MGRGPCTFKEADLVRALRAAKKAGIDVTRAEVGKDGSIILVLNTDKQTLVNIEHNEWDDGGDGSG
jgi:hypothetical protein